MLYAAISLALGFVANGVPAQRTAAPVIHMNEAAAKAAWLAGQRQGTPSWGPDGAELGPDGAPDNRRLGSSAMGAARVLNRNAPSTYDDHSNPMGRLGASGIQSARMPPDVPNQDTGKDFDDHNNPMGRLSKSNAGAGARMPLDTCKNEGAESKVY